MKITLLILITGLLLPQWAFTHSLPQIDETKLQAYQAQNSSLLDFISLHTITMSTDMVNQEACQSSLAAIDQKIAEGHHSIALHKAAMSCHLLNQDNQAVIAHQTQLLALAQLTWDEDRAKNPDQPIWISDPYSVYQLLTLLDYTVVDGTFILAQDKLLLEVYASKDTLFDMPFYFDVSTFAQTYDSYKPENPHLNQMYTLMFEDDLGEYNAVISLAFEGMPEALILFGDLIIKHIKTYPAGYSDALSFYQMTAEQGSAIGQFKYANRVFSDHIESHYPQAHNYLNQSIQQQYIDAFVLGIIVRENGLGIDKNPETIQALMELINLNTIKPGVLEYELYNIYSAENKKWNKPELAHAYLKAAAEKNHIRAIIDTGLTEKKYADKNNPHYQKAAQLATEPVNFLQLGIIYASGINTLENPQKAINYLKKAGDQGSAASYYILGMLFETPDLETTDLEQAYQAFKKSHELGYNSARIKMADYLIRGLGVDRDTDKGLLLMTEAANAGDNEALLYLGGLYHQGYFVDPDIDKAKTYYQRVQGELKVKAELNMLFLDYPVYKPAIEGEDFDQWLYQHTDTDDLAKFQFIYLLLEEKPFLANKYHLNWLNKQGKKGMAQAYLLQARLELNKASDRKVLKLYEKAHELGSVDATYEMAKLMKRNDRDGWDNLIQQAAAQEHRGAIAYLAKMYRTGDGFSQDKKKAIELYNKAYDAGAHWVAMELMEMYLNQSNDQHATQLAVSTLKKLAKDTQYAQPLRNLGEIYANRNFADHDMQQAFRYFFKAAEKGDSYAQIIMGRKFLTGDQVTQDFDIARFFFHNGTKNGHQEAYFWLALLAEKGWGMEKNAENAIALYKLAGTTYHQETIINNQSLLSCQLNTKNADHKTAYKAMSKLAETSPTAAFNLGWMYEHGLCVRSNQKKALKQYQKAHNMGSPYASYRLLTWYQNDHNKENDTQIPTLKEQSQKGFSKSSDDTFMTILMPKPEL